MRLAPILRPREPRLLMRPLSAVPAVPTIGHRTLVLHDALLILLTVVERQAIELTFGGQALQENEMHVQMRPFHDRCDTLCSRLCTDWTDARVAAVFTNTCAGGWGWRRDGSAAGQMSEVC